MKYFKSNKLKNCKYLLLNPKRKKVCCYYLINFKKSFDKLRLMRNLIA